MGSGGSNYEHPIESLVNKYREEFNKSRYSIVHYDINVNDFQAWLCEKLEESKKTKECVINVYYRKQEDLSDEECLSGDYSEVQIELDRKVVKSYGDEYHTSRGLTRALSYVRCLQDLGIVKTYKKKDILLYKPRGTGN